MKSISIILSTVATLTISCQQLKLPEQTVLDKRLEKQASEYRSAALPPSIQQINHASAVQRALKVNLSMQAARLDTATALASYDASLYRLLPRTTANLNYTLRNHARSNAGLFTNAPLSSRLNSQVQSSISGLQFATAVVTRRKLETNVKRQQFAKRTQADNIALDAIIAHQLSLVWQRNQHAITQQQTALKEEIKNIENTISLKAADSNQALHIITDLLSQQEQLSRLRLRLDQGIASYQDLLQLTTPPKTIQGKLINPHEVERFLQQTTVKKLTAYARKHRFEYQVYAAELQNLSDQQRLNILEHLPDLSISSSLKSDDAPSLRDNDWVEGQVSLSYNLTRLISSKKEREVAKLNYKRKVLDACLLDRATRQQLILGRVNLSNSILQYQEIKQRASLWKRIHQATKDSPNFEAFDEAREVIAAAHTLASRIEQQLAATDMLSYQMNILRLAGCHFTPYPQQQNINAAMKGMIHRTIYQPNSFF